MVANVLTSRMRSDVSSIDNGMQEMSEINSGRDIEPEGETDLTQTIRH